MGSLKAYNSQNKSRQQTGYSRQHVVNNMEGKRKNSLSTVCCLLSTKKKNSLSTTYCLLSTERGIALVMILVLSAIALAIMAGLIYMITTGTQVSGMQKRYKTALEAGVGGSDITYHLIGLRGEPSSTASFLNALSTPVNLYPVITTPGLENCTTCSGCCGTNKEGKLFCGLAAKLNTPSTSWSSACNTDSVAINPAVLTTYDMRLDLGASPYPTDRVYAKIVDTVEGNTGGEEGLLGKGVVYAGSGEISVMKIPYLYTIEVDAENPSNPSERAKLSILYQY